MEREIALKILVDYERDQAYLNITLNHYLDSVKDRHSKDLITVLVYGTIQYRYALEYQLKPFIKGRIKVYERMLLLMSMYQHMYMNIPDYAIVNESVSLCKKEKGPKSSKLVNAILRNSFQHTQSLDELSFEQRLSIETSHPLWMVKMFIKQYGKEVAQKICISDNEIPLKMARVNTLKITREAVLQFDSHFSASPYFKDSVYYQGGNIAHSEAFKLGYVTIQDESSQRVAPLLSPQKNERVLDMCCAPGSKTTHLAAIMENTGSIDAYDLYEHKLALVKENCERLGISNIQYHVGDSCDLHNFKGTYDRILLDGPCSGLGVLRRKPEIKYHDNSVMDEIIPIQEKLLENAYLLCKIGGNIVYSTCTINKKENEKQIDAFIARHPDMKRVEEQTILPYMYHSDGFYMCLMKKEQL